MTDLYSDLKSRLSDERESLRDELIAMGVDLDGGGLDVDNDEGFADSAASTAEKSERLGVIEQLRETLNEVEDALTRMDQGTYGKCERCGDEIPLPRLEARPHARLCISCQERS